MNMERAERILALIDQLGVVSVKQLSEILNVGTYRHTCRVIKQLSPYLNEIRSKQKIVYLNKEGRQLIGSENELKSPGQLEHRLMANDAFIHFSCPYDWRREESIEIKSRSSFASGIIIKGLNTINQKIIIPDAMFSRNGYLHLVEIDNTRKMVDNRKKIESYKELWKDLHNHIKLTPKLCYFTCSDKRKKEIEILCKGIANEVKTFKEIM